MGWFGPSARAHRRMWQAAGQQISSSNTRPGGAANALPHPRTRIAFVPVILPRLGMFCWREAAAKNTAASRPAPGANLTQGLARSRAVSSSAARLNHISSTELLKSRRQLKYHALAVNAACYSRSEEVAHSVGSHSVIQVGSVGRSSEGVEYALVPAASPVRS